MVIIVVSVGAHNVAQSSGTWPLQLFFVCFVLLAQTRSTSDRDSASKV
ncbi:hypothetical protein ABIF38_004894 [Bradyrhizobium japonicum]|nr:hypothetical protein [Bradyrhizobium elkanii]MCS3524390.1 hypothetical protein [Bradyrhizobium elkanii]MCS3568132.1 hypothetical protein [Bradyrhizobium elkanii]MCS3590385.1 hypothetical protein [Bradyrhizobium elkanii]MCS3619827.1 hypothetical protein [Bradyrhizobium elkanii]